jgi:hypothetical protein
MKKIYLAVIASFLCFPLFGQSLAANQVQINKKIFTIGTSVYDADYNVIFNQWFKGHKNASEAKPGEDLSWINDFNRNYFLYIQEGTISVYANDLGSVKIIKFSRTSEGIFTRSLGIGVENIEQLLVYDSKTGKLIGAQLLIESMNAYINVKTDFFDKPEFVFPLRVSAVNSAVSNINTTSGFISYKNVYEFNLFGVQTGLRQSIYQVSGEIAKKLKDADDYARVMKEDIPILLGRFTESAASKSGNANTQPKDEGFKNATHKLTAELNIFSQQDGGSAVVASLKKDDTVQVLEYGEYASWNGITAKWAKVQTRDNKTGWLFSGYLEELAKR